MTYDPYEGLSLDILRALVAGMEWVALFHFYNRGEGRATVDIVQEMLYDANQAYYLPEAFYTDWQEVKDTEAFELVTFKWAKIFKRLRGDRAS